MVFASRGDFVYPHFWVLYCIQGLFSRGWNIIPPRRGSPLTTLVWVSGTAPNSVDPGQGFEPRFFVCCMFPLYLYGFFVYYTWYLVWLYYMGFSIYLVPGMIFSPFSVSLLQNADIQSVCLSGCLSGCMSVHQHGGAIQSASASPCRSEVRAPPFGFVCWYYFCSLFYY